MHGLPRGGLVTHGADLRRRRSDKVDVRRDAGLGELGVLGEKSIAGMNGVRTGDLRRGDDARDIEIRLARRRRPDANVVIGKADVKRLAIGFGIDRDGLDA